MREPIDTPEGSAGVAATAGGAPAETRDELVAGPEDKERAIAYYDGLGESYEEYTGWGPLAYFRRHERACVLRLLDTDGARGATLLDVGCGTGFYARRAQEAGLRVCAVDAAPAMVQAVSRFVSEAFVADIDTLPTDRRFDRVLCAGVLDFLPDPEAAFRRLCALTAPGGRLVVLAPRKSLGGRLYRLEKRLRGLRANLFSRVWFERAAAPAGLAVVDACHAAPNSIAVALLHRSNSH